MTACRTRKHTALFICSLWQAGISLTHSSDPCELNYKIHAQHKAPSSFCLTTPVLWWAEQAQHLWRKTLVRTEWCLEKASPLSYGCPRIQMLWRVLARVSECRATRLYWLSSDPWGAERMEDWGYTLWQGKARTKHSGGDAQRMGCNDQWYIRSPESWSLLCLLLCVAVNGWAWLTGFYPFVFPFRRANIGTDNSASKGKSQALTSSEPC